MGAICSSAVISRTFFQTAAEIPDQFHNADISRQSRCPWQLHDTPTGRLFRFTENCPNSMIACCHLTKLILQWHSKLSKPFPHRMGFSIITAPRISKIYCIWLAEIFSEGFESFQTSSIFLSGTEHIPPVLPYGQSIFCLSAAGIFYGSTGLQSNYGHTGIAADISFAVGFKQFCGRYPKLLCHVIDISRRQRISSRLMQHAAHGAVKRKRLIHRSSLPQIVYDILVFHPWYFLLK